MSSLGYEGFDHENNYHLNQQEEKKESWSQAKIWVVLAVFFAICIALVLYMHTKELLLKYNGNSIATEYNSDKTTVKIQDEEGNPYYISLSDTIISQKGDSITLYYWGDNMGSAKPMTATWYWVVMYCIWISLFAICLRFVIKNLYHGKQQQVTV